MSKVTQHVAELVRSRGSYFLFILLLLHGSCFVNLVTCLPSMQKCKLLEGRESLSHFFVSLAPGTYTRCSINVC